MKTYNETILNALTNSKKTNIDGEKVRVSYGGNSHVFGLRPVAYVLNVDSTEGEVAGGIMNLKRMIDESIYRPRSPYPLQRKPRPNPAF